MGSGVSTENLRPGRHMTQVIVIGDIPPGISRSALPVLDQQEKQAGHLQRRDGEVRNSYVMRPARGAKTPWFMNPEQLNGKVNIHPYDKEPPVQPIRRASCSISSISSIL